jgi:GMP synthase (glutamine-hydrolysing)
MDKILVLDFGSQTTQLIARRVRELHVYSEIHPFNLQFDKIKDFNPTGIVLSGSPARVIDKDVPHIDMRVLELGVPVLGICYGMQEMARVLGGEVAAAPRREYGFAEIKSSADSILLSKLAVESSARCATVWMSHNDVVSKLPKGFKISSSTKDCGIASMEDDAGRLFGTQFHPEVTHTKIGAKLFERFVLDICKCRQEWTMKSFIDKEIERIRTKVQNEHVVLGLSGGVDSSVTAALIQKAIGDRLTCIFVDNGLLRKNEAAKVEQIFKDKFNFNLICIDAGERFIKKLAGVTDPEKKRKIIGEEFIRVFEETAGKKAAFLAQGTLYPDVIESISFRGPSSTIKSHHNVGGLPEKMGLKLIEPLRELFKDEVRELGRELGLPNEILMRQPFPGPGLAVRVIGEITNEDLSLLREADDILINEIKAAGWYEKLWQSFCVLLPIKTVGVMGDERTYERVAAIRAVTSTDGMTADWAELPAELLRTISNKIINGVKGINRVVYDISSKPPSTIEWE